MFQFECKTSKRLLVPLLLCGSLQLLSGCSKGSTNAFQATASSAVSVSISGQTQVRVGTPVQFVASVANSSNTKVDWLVDGVVGGSNATGTITASGLYTAPSTIPTSNTVTIGADSEASQSASASVTATLLNPLPIISAASAKLTSDRSRMLVDVTGSGFVPGAQIQVGGVAVSTTAITSGELQSTLPVPAGMTTVALAVANPNPGASVTGTLSVTLDTSLASFEAASRLLDQATFGPTLADIGHVRQVGIDAYLTEQFGAASTSLSDIPNPTPAYCALNNLNPCFNSEWWQAALTGNDQLRQRVAFALSEMFVVSTNTLNANAAVSYQNTLLNDAFGNFSTLLHDVTLSPAMGAYLNMLNSSAPATGQISNENYAREAMQLFSIGLYELNQDGTPKADSSGNMIPTYTLAQVQAFARAYTGWTYAMPNGNSPTTMTGTPNFDHLMVPVESKHDKTAKVLLGGTTLPPGQSAKDDLAGALANLFAHPNVAPFFCRQLIQHLVTSNPSPAYVSRISAVFLDNGSGVRGDLQAVVRATLLDPEARAGDTDPTVEGGKLREPVLYLTDVMRGLGYVNTDANGYFGTLSGYSGVLSESPFAAGSVFNFFPPDYKIPGSTATSPEFDLENTASAVLRLSLANNLTHNTISGFTVDLSATSTLGAVAKSPSDLVDSLSLLFMHSQMPTEMRTAIVKHISSLSDMSQRVRVATYLVITSSLYKVQH